ncbi:MAG: DUF4340 domain-containing protein [Fusicatenibacter sp.]|nr:DUF4340 domain-containing protein [Fusicatenibacter sp.]
MSRSKKIGALLGVLLIVCVGTICVSKYEEQKEQIKNSDEIVMELNTEDVTSLSWEYEGEDETISLAFHKDETWLYDEDENFPVDEEKVNELLETFQALGASFIIEDVEDYAQYGLEEPVCTINIGTEEESYEILLGDYSTMDEERYVSFGDGNVYLVSSDPMETYELELKDMIQHDEIPDFDSVQEIQFTGSENYTVIYSEENKITYSEKDVYFVENEDETLPLDSSNVRSYARSISSLGLSEYVTYNASEEEITSYGLDDPELSITIWYTTEEEEDKEEDEEESKEQTSTFVLNISRDPKEREEASEDASDEETDEEEEITAYARIGDSQIVYQLDGSDYETLMAASYNDLRHQKIIWADFDDVTQVDITLEDVEYTLIKEEEDKKTLWYYQEEEIEISEFEDALTALTASEFTEEDPVDKEEIGLTIHLDNENVQEVELSLYRHDGSSCMVKVDGKPVALVSRSSVVDLMEAVNAIVLN